MVELQQVAEVPSCFEVQEVLFRLSIPVFLECFEFIESEMVPHFPTEAIRYLQHIYGYLMVHR